MKVNLLAFTKEDGSVSCNFNLNEALMFCAKMAGICYKEDGFAKIKVEDEAVTLRRLNQVLTSGHHSVFDHVKLTFEFCDIPKIIAMILNNEKDYATSEKSARYTHFGDLSGMQSTLYNKWYDMLIPVIKEKYPCLINENAKDPYIKIKKLAQENARYFVSIFEPVTTMGYTVSLRQINYIIYMINNYIETAEDSDFNKQLIPLLEEFVMLFDGYIVKGLIPSGKDRKLSLFGDKAFFDIKDNFSYTYQTSFLATYSCMAQNHRHRTEHSFIYNLDEFKFYVPEILEDNPELEQEWLEDAKLVKDIYPQGRLVKVVQTGNIDTLILKCRERACGQTQLETMRHSIETLQKAIKYSEFKDYILDKTNGATARCKFKNHGKCDNPCFLGARQVERKI